MHKLSKELIGASSIPIILSILSKDESYGYQIIQEVKKISNGKLAWSEGTLYPVLHKLEKKGLITSTWKVSETNRKRKYYVLSKTGKKTLQTEQQNWSFIHSIITQLWQPWKAQLSANGQFNQDNIAELENHLYEEMDQLKQYNLNDEEAYYIAQKRLGNIKDLQQEYAKVNTAQSIYKKILPYINGVLIFFLVCSLLEVTLHLSMYAGSMFLKDWGYLSYMLSNLVFIILCSGGIFLILKKLNWQISTYLILGSILLLQLIAGLIFPLSADCHSTAYDWMKYFSNAQVLLLPAFGVFAAFIYYKNKKADQIQFS